MIFLLCLLVISVPLLPTILAEGKTKIIHADPENENLAIIESKDDITAFNNAKHDIIIGKSCFATKTTCNVFSLLQQCGIPVAFLKQLDEKRFSAPLCGMIPYEVVVRREAHGSFVKRNPHLSKGHYFPKLIVEFFLKTNNREWQGTAIPKDDPLIRFENDIGYLYEPDIPLYQQKPFMILDNFPLRDYQEYFAEMNDIAKKTFLILEKAWQLCGARLVDFKLEFGFHNKLLLADVIDNDSWRVVYDNEYIDKQVYREGGDLNKVTALYNHVAQLTSRFTIPKQRIILWRGSEKDDIEPFIKAFEPFSQSNCSLTCITVSAHKEPVRCYAVLQKLIQEIPDCVIIAYVGASNAAGPLLSANGSVPVITVPATWRQCPEDVWSSLRTPSKVTAMAVLDPHNAVLAAIQILSLQNPALYATMRYEQEKRLTNIIELA